MLTPTTIFLLLGFIAMVAGVVTALVSFSGSLPTGWRLRLHLLGLLAIGTGLGLFAIGFTLHMFLVHEKVHLDLFFAAVSGYYAFKTLRSWLVQKQQAASVL